MSSTSALPTPDGDVSKGSLILAITWVSGGIATVAILLRIWTRLSFLNSWGWDDASMCLAVVCAYINSALLSVSVHYGTGRHIVYLSSYEAIMANKFNWISQGFHVMSTNWGKVSIALFLLRIVDRARSQKKYFYAGIALLTIINAGSVGIIYGQCQYSTDLWLSERKGSCWSPLIHRNVAFFQGSFSAFSDLVLALYPVFVIWNLQMAVRLKLIVCFVMTLGIVAMAGAIVKTINLSELASRADYTFETSILCIWVALEQYLIIIAACIPALAPLFKVARESSKRASSRRKYQYGRYTSGTQGSTSNGRPLRSNGGVVNYSRSRLEPEDGYEGYSLGQYGVKSFTQTGAHDETTFEGDNDSEEAIMNDSCYPGGIVRTMEVEIQSKQGSEGEMLNAHRYKQGGSMVYDAQRI